MKKIISILVCVCVILSAMVFTASAADSATSYAVTETFTSGTAYKFGVAQENLGKTIYLNGQMSSYYMATTEDVDAAIDVYLEDVSGGYQLYAMVGGAKNYLNIAANAAGTHVNVTYDAVAKSVYTYDTTLKTFITKATKSGVESDYAFGTYGTYNTASPSDVKVHSDNFFFKLYAPVADTEGGDVTPPVDDDEEVTPPADEDAVNNIVLTVDTLGLEASKYTAGTATVNGADFEWVQLGNYGDGIQMRDNPEKGTSMFWNTSAFGAAIKEIKLTYSDTKNTYDNPDAEILSFGNEVDTYTYETKLSTVAGTKEYIITPDAETYTFFKFEHDYDKSAYWASITIVLVGGKDVEIVPPATDDKEEDVTPPVSDATAVANPVAGTAYKYALIQENLGKVLYVTGEMDAEKTYYMATTENVAEAADVYLEETEGGYFIYALAGGVKKYMNIIESEGNDGKMHINAVYGETGVSVFTQNDKNVFVTKVGEIDYAFGTYNTFNTISPSDYNKYPDNFWCKFYAGEVVSTPSTDVNKEDTTTNDTNNGDGEKLTFGVVEQPVEGTAYKFGMYQGNLKKTLYITGEMDGFYMATTEDVSKAADVYLEKANGGYYIYALVNGAKRYLGIEEATGSDGKTHINAVFADAPKSVFTYNTTLKTYVTKVGDKEYAFGTRNDREFKTVSPSETKYTENFVCQFYGMVKGGTSPATGDSVGAIAVMAMAAAAIVIAASKKR